jgi:thiol-disulfide isomerase/thioredoxin
MGKAERIRRMNAREKIAVQQAAARRAESRRRMLIAGGSVFGVLVIVIVLIAAKTFSNTPTQSGTGSGSAAASVARQLSTVPAATLDAVGKGSASPLIATKGQPPLTADGKPRIVYMGAEYCPYCAAERWAMTVALSRFGSFSGLKLIHSSSSDVYPNTPTLTFAHATYTSKYVDFSPVEMYGLKNNGIIFQKPTSAESALMAKYDAAPYVPSADASSFPFVDIGDQYLVIGAQYIPSTLAGLSWSEVASDVRDPSSAVAKGIDGAANSITAAICKITKNAPAAVCNSAAAKAGAGLL